MAVAPRPTAIQNAPRLGSPTTCGKRSSRNMASEISSARVAPETANLVLRLDIRWILTRLIPVSHRAGARRTMDWLE